MKLKQAREIADRLNFEKGRGLVTAIAQDSGSREVLMVAFMNRDAFLKTVTTGRMWYYSRSRKRLWMKGESSGNVQLVENFYTDCDGDSVLFGVKQKGNACHTGNRTCFFRGYGKRMYFDLDELFSLILDRKVKPKSGSYTNKLLKNQKKLLGKIREESDELIEAAELKDKDEVVWEACDLLYHMLVLLARKDISLNDIYTELGKRHKS
jgi:phosphoribosyl-ATP pyrophosphohydrolase/phosphoribosyl-AMP cyclohydrolase